ncbi:hypothetical protein ACFX10_033910 [Malus domestica]
MPSARLVSMEMWKIIWHLEVPSKIRHFLWLTLHQGLPTRVALFKRRLSPSPTYPLFLCDDEIVKHVFLSCPWVEVLWFGGALNYKVDRAGIHSRVRWLQAVLSNLGFTANRKWFQAYVAFTCWYIWKAQCDFVFNQVSINLAKGLFALSNASGAFLHAVKDLGTHMSEVGVWEALITRWSPLTSPFIKINVDAS